MSTSALDGDSLDTYSIFSAATEAPKDFESELLKSRVYRKVRRAVSSSRLRRRLPKLHETQKACLLEEDEDLIDLREYPVMESSHYRELQEAMQNEPLHGGTTTGAGDRHTDHAGADQSVEPLSNEATLKRRRHRRHSENPPLFEDSKNSDCEIQVLDEKKQEAAPQQARPVEVRPPAKPKKARAGATSREQLSDKEVEESEDDIVVVEPTVKVRRRRRQFRKQPLHEGMKNYESDIQSEDSKERRKNTRPLAQAKLRRAERSPVKSTRRGPDNTKSSASFLGTLLSMTNAAYKLGRYPKDLARAPLSGNSRNAKRPGQRSSKPSREKDLRSLASRILKPKLSDVLDSGCSESYNSSRASRMPKGDLRRSSISSASESDTTDSKYSYRASRISKRDLHHSDVSDTSESDTTDSEYSYRASRMSKRDLHHSDVSDSSESDSTESNCSY